MINNWFLPYTGSRHKVNKKIVNKLLLSAKPYISESNFLKGRSWAYF